jgi:hypothetical protein
MAKPPHLEGVVRRVVPAYLKSSKPREKRKRSRYPARMEAFRLHGFNTDKKRRCL